MTEDTDNGYAARLAEAMGTTSTQALADHLGVSYQAVQKVLKGASKSFNLANHYRVADYLGVNPRWLAIGEGQKLPQSRRELETDWRTVAKMVADQHVYEEGKIALMDFIARVDETYEKINSRHHIA